MTWLEQHISLHSDDSPAEETANSLSHLLGAVLGIIGLVLLLRQADGTTEALAYTVFGLSMILLFSASTAYHMSPPGSQIKRLFRLMDHISIFLLIAGTYTPVMAAIGTAWAYWILGAVWLLAVTGIILKIVLWDRFKRWQLFFFLGMGWLAVLRIGEVLRTLPVPFFILLLSGGVLYSIGTIFYSLRKMPYHHAIWHLFVLGGAGSFFWGVYGYL